MCYAKSTPFSQDHLISGPNKKLKRPNKVMVYQQKSITNGNLARVSSQLVSLREDLHLKLPISPQDVKFCCNSKQLSIEHYTKEQRCPHKS